MKILIKHDQYFGPFPKSYCDPGFARAHVLPIVLFVLQAVSSDKRTPFSWVSERQFSKEDKALLLKIMKLDPRDRPTARELLDEGWFSVEQADMEENAIV
jgi:serine/threonine protein kinase